MAGRRGMPNVLRFDSVEMSIFDLDLESSSSPIFFIM